MSYTVVSTEHDGSSPITSQHTHKGDALQIARYGNGIASRRYTVLDEEGNRVAGQPLLPGSAKEVQEQAPLTRTERLVKLLRHLADLEHHPDIDIQNKAPRSVPLAEITASYEADVSMTYFGEAYSKREVERINVLVDHLFGLEFETARRNGWTHFNGYFEGLTIHIMATQGSYCDRVQVGEETIPAEPEKVIPAQPERVVPKFEYVCKDPYTEEQAA